MAAHKSETKQKGIEMLAQGMAAKDVAAELGVSVKTAHSWKLDMEKQTGKWTEKKEKAYHGAPPGFAWEWTDAVNRIRRACGKPPLPEPKGEGA